MDEETFIKAYLMTWNELVENRENFMDQWKEMDTGFMLKTLNHVKVFEDGT